MTSDSYLNSLPPEQASSIIQEYLSQQSQNQEELGQTYTKICSKCGEEKPLSEYYSKDFPRKNGKIYYYPKCKPCYIETVGQRQYYKRDLAPPKPEHCECCGRAFGSKACYDHDHDTGKFRGWLCYQCNTGIGSLGDNIAGLMAAVDYLNRVYETTH